MSLYNIDWIHRSAEVFYWVRKDLRNKGYGQKALLKLLRLGFSKYNLHRIEAKLGYNNMPSKKILDHLNFRLEGRLREKYLNNGVYYDALIYSLLESDNNKL